MQRFNLWEEKMFKETRKKKNKLKTTMSYYLTHIRKLQYKLEINECWQGYRDFVNHCTFHRDFTFVFQLPRHK